MFGREHDLDPSEGSPRAPSPWDPFLPSPSSEPSSFGKRIGIPKLEPEVEEGNVEYKLKLTNISPARFDRLVTQLKWRLLEGGGQAYYELGVADSGALIGLSSADLEQSLETLEMMAGEIGASVIVVKEIEVPPLMVAFADKLSGYLDPDTGRWSEKMTRGVKAIITSHKNPSSPSDGSSEEGTELSMVETSDNEDRVLAPPYESPWSSPSPSPRPFATTPDSHRSFDPPRPNVPSSPLIFPIDDDLALFSMEPDPCVSGDVIAEAHPPIELDNEWVSVDLEINSVYKPRPFRRRAVASLGPAPPGFGKHGRKVKDKKKHPWHVPRPPAAASLGSEVSLTEEAIQKSKETKALQRRQARDLRRQQKRDAFLASLQNSDGSLDSGASFMDSPGFEKLVLGIQEMHVSVQDAPVVLTSTHARAGGAGGDVTTLPQDKRAQTDAELLAEPFSTAEKEPRFIVEALIVRKLSLEEAYLDFGGF